MPEATVPDSAKLDVHPILLCMEALYPNNDLGANTSSTSNETCISGRSENSKATDDQGGEDTEDSEPEDNASHEQEDGDHLSIPTPVTKPAAIRNIRTTTSKTVVAPRSKCLHHHRAQHSMFFE
jgi:hypothetical protein